MELQLQLALSTRPLAGSDPTQEEAFSGVPRTLPLFSRGESNGNYGEKKEDLFAVGWPPVKSWRKELCHHNRGRRRSSYMYVKVKMEGVGIMRKLDLSLHRSYPTLFANFASLFGICEENVEKYWLVFQNKEGDWLHARDVPWESFIKSVKRLKLEKNGY